MLKRAGYWMACAFVYASVGACSFGGDDADLKRFIAEIKATPAGVIEPLPTFSTYESFTYSASVMRSPFDPPVDVKMRVRGGGRSDIEPDNNREKEYLESFDLSSIAMVGTLEKGGTLWALIRDPSGGIQWVTNGNYLGKNHGRIVDTSETQIELLEIVSDGLGKWLERPRILALSEKE